MPRYIDPHLDPLRAPSRAGHHPHLVPEGPSRVNPQQMYERRDQLAHQYRPMPQRRPMGAAQAPPANDAWGKVFVGLGILAAVYAGYKLAQGARDDEVRRNPSPEPAPVTPAQLVVMPAPIAALPAPAVTAVPSEIIASPIPAPAQPAPKKRRVVRKTTQDRNEDGTYKRAGTLKRPKTEGKGKKS